MSAIHTVSTLLSHMRELLEEDSTLANVWLEGEVSNFKQASSGHCYFTLKDAKAVLSCVMWRADALRLSRLPADGEQVLVHGYVSVYEAQGRLQLYADNLELAGLGRLHREFEALKERLAAAGLFDPARKRSLPPWPKRIGVVTSPQAAALRDIVRTLAARFPAVEVLLAPTAVQGIDAPPQIVAALELLNRWNATREPVDLIILARGGGSIEELWAFNDERVVRAIAASLVPVISGVGHETDFTLADFAADARAATPTGAAALAVPDRQELATQVQVTRQRLTVAMDNYLAGRRQRVAQADRLMARLSPRATIASQRQGVDERRLALARQMRHYLQLKRLAAQSRQARLASLDPHAVLMRGYAIVQHEASGQIVSATDQVIAGDRLHIVVADGSFNSVVVP